MDVATRAAVAFCKGTAEVLADFHVAPKEERKGFLDSLGVPPCQNNRRDGESN